MGGKKPKYGALSSQATQYTNLGNQFLSNYLGGNLAPAQEAQLNLAQNRGDTAIRTAYSNAGISAGSTMQAQDEANLGLQTEALRGQLLEPYLRAAQDFYSGASGDLKDILGVQEEQYQADNQLFSSTIGDLFSALGGTDLGNLFGGGGGGGSPSGTLSAAQLAG